jgi:hypothetical protein
MEPKGGYFENNFSVLIDLARNIANSWLLFQHFPHRIHTDAYSGGRERGDSPNHGSSGRF